MSIVQTDAQGNYRLEGVMPGRFYITAGLVDLPSYYPGVISINEARVVTVAGGAAISGIDFKMGRAVALTVRGHVKLDAGATLPQLARVLMTGSAPGNSRNLIVPSDGSFAFDGVPPGRYTIGVSPTYGTSPQQIVLSDKDLEIELVIRPTVVASGKVVVEGNGARPRINLHFMSGATAAASLGVSSNGTFNVQLPAGTYRLEVGGVPPGYRLKSVTAGSMDWSKTILLFKSERPCLNLSSRSMWILRPHG
jgi:hypothetical protein